VAPRSPGRRRGALEQEVLACLATAGRPLTPGEVRTELGDQLAYTTIMTTLSRLHAKGAVSRLPAARGFAYELSGGPAAAAPAGWFRCHRHPLSTTIAVVRR
jgi:hypothetical protein